MSSIRETAEEIAKGWSHDEYHGIALSDAIEQALRDERERAARIVETAYVNTMFAVGLRTVLAAAIRKED